MLRLLTFIIACVSLLPASVSAQDEPVILNAVVVIPLAYERPDRVIIDNDEETWYNMEVAIESLDQDVYAYTNGLVDFEVEVIYLDMVTPDMYADVEGWFVDPRAVQNYLGITNDFFFVLTDPDATTTVYKGLTINPDAAAWVYGYYDADNVILHELGHILELLLNRMDYYLTACIDLPASYVHCGEYSGFVNSHEDAWMEAFYAAIPLEAWQILGEYE